MKSPVYEEFLHILDNFNWLLKTYDKKIRELLKTKSAVDENLKNLYALRQVLIEKNLIGVFSDEILKEQNAIIEERIIVAQAAKNDALIDKYNINMITEFIKGKIMHLDETYSTSSYVFVKESV